MMYESPDYCKLKQMIAHYEAIKRDVDRARVFRSMCYGSKLTLTTAGDPLTDTGEHTIILNDHAKNNLLRFAAEHFEQAAHADALSLPEPFNIAEACKV